MSTKQDYINSFMQKELKNFNAGPYGDGETIKRAISKAYVIAGRIKNVADINLMYENALSKKQEAQKRVEAALSDAEKLVDKAASLGKLDPRTHKFFKHEWSSKKDQISALEACVKELAEYGEDTAQFQENIVKIQNASLESQKAVMEVQKMQMEYMEGTINVMKFLYKLSTYGIASTQSIVTNLELVLSGAKKKDLGEMAKQQMYLVMDQLKSQENLSLRMKKDEARIGEMEDELRIYSQIVNEQTRRIEAGEEKDKEQDEKIQRQTQEGEMLNKRMTAGEEKDKNQDEEIHKQGEIVKAHDKRIEAGEKKDLDQDERIRIQTEKGMARDLKIEAGEKKDIAQDEELLRQARKDEEHDRRLDHGDEKDEHQDEQIDQLKHRIEVLENKYDEVFRRANDSIPRKISIVFGAVGIVAMVMAIVSLIL